MDLIVDQVMQLEVVHIADGDLVGELLAGTAVVDGGLAVVGQVDLGEVDDVPFSPIRRSSLVGYSGAFSPCHLAAGPLRSSHAGRTRGRRRRQGSVPSSPAPWPPIAQVGLPAPDPMFIRDERPGGSARYSSGVPSGRKGMSSCGRMRGNNALVAVTAGHLVADADLTLLGDVAAHAHPQHRAAARRCSRREDLDIHHDTVGTVGHTQRGVADFACLFTEDGAQQRSSAVSSGLTLGVTLPPECRRS